MNFPVLSHNADGFLQQEDFSPVLFPVEIFHQSMPDEFMISGLLSPSPLPVLRFLRPQENLLACQ